MHTTTSLWPTSVERAAYIDPGSFPVDDANALWSSAADRIEGALKDLADTDMFVLLMVVNEPNADLVRSDMAFFQETESACAKAAEVPAIFNYVGARLKLARAHAAAGSFES